jgi:hypothetical protein
MQGLVNFLVNHITIDDCKKDFLLRQLMNWCFS